MQLRQQEVCFVHNGRVSAWCQTVQPCLSLTLSAVSPMSPSPLDLNLLSPTSFNRSPSASSRQTTDGLVEDGETGYASIFHGLTTPPNPPLIPATDHVTLYLKSSFHIFIIVISFFSVFLHSFFFFTWPIPSIHVSIHLPSNPPWPLLFWFPSQRFIHPSEHPVLSIPFIGMIVILAVVWCWLSELASQRARYGTSLSLSAAQVAPGK